MMDTPTNMFPLGQKKGAMTLERRVELLEERVRIEDNMWREVGEAKRSIREYMPPPKKVEVVATLDGDQESA